MESNIATSMCTYFIFVFFLLSIKNNNDDKFNNRGCDTFYINKHFANIKQGFYIFIFK